MEGERESERASERGRASEREREREKRRETRREKREESAPTVPTPVHGKFIVPIGIPAVFWWGVLGLFLFSDPWLGTCSPEGPRSAWGGKQRLKEDALYPPTEKACPTASEHADHLPVQVGPPGSA